MDAQLTVRLTSDELKRVRDEADRLGLKKSDIVRMAIRAFLEEGSVSQTGVYERVKHLIGSVHSGVGNLGERHSEYMMEELKKNA